MALRVLYNCPFCGHEVQGRGKQMCPHCRLRSQGSTVADFDEALQALLDAKGGWETLLGALEALDGEQVYDHQVELVKTLRQLEMAADELRDATEALREQTGLC